MKKKLNLKIIIPLTVLLVAIAVGITIFLLKNNSNLGINGNTPGNIANGGVVGIDKNKWIYYSNGFDKMFKLKNDDGEESTIESKEQGGYEYINVVGDWVYYTEFIPVMAGREDYSIYTVYKIKTDGSQKTKIEETKQGCYDYLTVSGDWIYYVDHNVKDHRDYNIYKMKTDGSNKTRVASSDGQIDYLNVVGDWIYYRELIEKTGNTTVYKVKNDGSNKKYITKSAKISYAYLSVIGDWIYYYEDSLIYKMKLDGSGSSKIANSDIKFYDDFNVVGDWIYYSGKTSLGDKGSLYKMKLDGSNNTKITSGKDYYSALNIVGDWIFYQCGNDHYKIKTNGSDENKIDF